MRNRFGPVAGRAVQDAEAGIVELQGVGESMSGNMLNGAQVIVDYLIQEKVPQVFGLCGHGNIQLIDALYERSDELKTISVHHESVGGRRRPSLRVGRARPISRSRSAMRFSIPFRSSR
jgi:hypothetical protein